MRNGTPIPFSHAPFRWDIPPWLSIRLCVHAGSSFGVSLLHSDIFGQNGGGIAPLLPSWYVFATHGSAPGGLPGAAAQDSVPLLVNPLR